MRRFLTLISLALVATPAAGERIKDLASVAGVRANQLVGYGLVVGLEGSGDQTSQAPFTVQGVKNFLQQFGVTVPENLNPQLKNVAAVSLHADLPAFAKPGQTIDVTISSIGNAQSLRGGSLLMAPLRGADGAVYAIAQGSVVVSGFGASGRDGSRVSVNITSAGRIPNGATVERPAPSGFAELPTVLLNLHTPDFTTAARLVDAVNAALGAGTARALDSVSVSVAAPSDTAQRISYVSVLENIEVEPGAAPARVIVNSRTGTVVIGAHVRVMPAAVSHGSLTVTITESAGVSQPSAFGEGDTVVVDRSEVEIVEDESRMFLFEPGVTLNEIVAAVNQVGAAPGDLVAILEALKQAGSLRAELIVI